MINVNFEKIDIAKLINVLGSIVYPEAMYSTTSTEDLKAILMKLAHSLDNEFTYEIQAQSVENGIPILKCRDKLTQKEAFTLAREYEELGFGVIIFEIGDKTKAIPIVRVYSTGCSDLKFSLQDLRTVDIANDVRKIIGK